MTIEEIKKNAPVGATHYRLADYGMHNVKYYKCSCGVFYFKSYDEDWYPSKIVTSFDQLEPL